MPYRYHYDPHQPRIPSGQHGGGEWTSGGNANSILQPVRYTPRTPRTPDRPDWFEQVLARFSRLSRHNSPNARAVLGFNARRYNRKDPDSFTEKM
jgi:hypothetical protein